MVAAADQFERASLVGYEINESYVEIARTRLPANRSRVEARDFFTVDWDRIVSDLASPILVTGNPPWVTNSVLGVIGSGNLPAKQNFKGLTGYEALTGRSNFDVSEWMLLRLVEALQGREATIAVLCKTTVARRVIEYAAKKRWDLGGGGLWRIDAMRHFRAAVDAVLFVCRISSSRTEATRHQWPIYESLDARNPSSTMAVIDGAVVADAERVMRTAHLVGKCDPEWRSGLKHDCSRVMELERGDGGPWVNGLGEPVELEDAVVFPLLKSSDVANGGSRRDRAMVVPQSSLGQDTTSLQTTAPRAWKYLSSHREALGARKSSIYRGQPEFAIFGIGPYSFAPWKVAISGLYKKCRFTLIGPRGGKPVMLDDTCYFLPFKTEESAMEAWAALSSPLAQDFFSAHIFWDAKRPINKALLQKLDLAALVEELKFNRPAKVKQQRLF